MIAALERGDVRTALDVMHIDAAAFAVFQTAIAQAFTAGGAAGASSMPTRRPGGARLVVRFDASNLQAEKWLRDHSSEAVRNIVDDQRTMIRRVLEEGMARGDNPRTVALDLVGRIGQDGRRQGGLIGLTANQERYAQTAARELAGDNLENYLTRKARDKRLDRHVQKAIADGTPIPADTQRKMVNRYRDTLLKVRGDTIGRTEAMASLHHGRREAYSQAIESGMVQYSEITRTWRSAGGKNARDTHAEMDGQVVGMNEPYTTPDGNQLMHPGDPSAPASEIINCRCTEDIGIDFLSRLRT